MSGDLPVWATAKAVLATCWRARAVALRYAAVPFLLSLLFDVAPEAVNIPAGEDLSTAAIGNIVSLLVYAPLLVTWFRGVIHGEAAARERPVFTFGKLETWVVLTSLLVGIVSIVPGVILGGLVLLVSGIIATISQVAGQVATVLLAVLAAFLWLMIQTQLSVAIAASALGRHLRLRDGWRMTLPIALPFTWTHILLAVAAVAVSALPCAIVAIVGGVAIATHVAGVDTVLNLGTAVATEIVDLAYTLLTTTLFGLVYRRLNADTVSDSNPNDLQTT